MAQVTFTPAQVQQSKRDEAIRRIYDLRLKAEKLIQQVEQAAIDAANLGCAEGRIKAVIASELFQITY